MLSISHVQYRYKNAKDIYTYDMEVQAGQVVAILGASGSGKSTLLDIIAGFVEPSSGTINFNRQELIGLTVEKRPVSILFQNHNLFEHLNVEKNILLGVSKREDNMQKMQAILKKVGLEKYQNSLASKLSGGQQQRVALARVLLRREPILLLDEPFTGLDEKTRVQMLELVRQITTEHKLHTIMVTHDKEDAERIADAVYRMHDHTLTRS